jgi:serine protease AprX
VGQLVALLLLCAPVASASVPGGAAAVTARILVQETAPHTDDAEELVGSLGGAVLRPLPIVGGFAAAVPAGALRDLLAAPSVSAVSVDAPLRLAGGRWSSAGEDDPLAEVAEAVGAGALHEAGIDGSGVDVALVDSGVVPVSGLGNVIHGPDLSFESQQPGLAHLDSFGHGTHLAGIVAGRTGGDFRGLAPGARIVSLKVADAFGATDVSQVIAAIDWVVQHRNAHGLRIRVLLLAFGTDARQAYEVDPLAHAVEVAWQRGIAVVVSAGNSGSAGLTNPARTPHVIAVGAADIQVLESRPDSGVDTGAPVEPVVDANGEEPEPTDSHPADPASDTTMPEEPTPGDVAPADGTAELPGGEGAVATDADGAGGDTATDPADASPAPEGAGEPPADPGSEGEPPADASAAGDLPAPGTDADASATVAAVPSWSSLGDGIRNPDVVAPGVAVVSLRAPGSVIDEQFPGARVGPDERYFRGSGTSQAAAVVAGVAALLIDQRPWLHPDALKALLTSTARPLGAPSEAQGAGLVDAEAAATGRASAKGERHPRSDGSGSLDAARGSMRLVDADGNELAGEQDIFGAAWDADRQALASRLGVAWWNGRWNGTRWTGDGFDGGAWEVARWSEPSWSGRAWEDVPFSGRRWSGSSWSGGEWVSQWSGRRWSGHGWLAVWPEAAP